MASSLRFFFFRLNLIFHNLFHFFGAGYLSHFNKFKIIVRVYLPSFADNFFCVPKAPTRN